jgi:hypothetical protein
MKYFFTFLFLVFNFLNALAQNIDGYWDEERAIERPIPLEDGERKYISVSIPVGTTQIQYQVSFLDKNGEIRSSLSSTLGSVPSGGSTQGAAAAISLLNSIGGDNKGSFHIFQSQDDAAYYVNSGEPINSCYSRTNIHAGEKSFLNINEIDCFTSNTSYLYLAFFNANEYDDVKVVIELTPWIDNTASRGWTLEIKEYIYNSCVEQGDVFIAPEEVCQCILDKLQENYKYQDFQEMIVNEASRITQEYGYECMEETGEDENQIDILRDEIKAHAKAEEYGEAISKSLSIIDDGYADNGDYNRIGWYYILTKQYLKAIKYLKVGEKMDETDLYIKGNLAHAYLLNNDFEIAKDIYVKYKTQNVDEDMSWIEMVQGDFKTFLDRGLPTENFQTIMILIIN